MGAVKIAKIVMSACFHFYGSTSVTVSFTAVGLVLGNHYSVWVTPSKETILILNKYPSLSSPFILVASAERNTSNQTVQYNKLKNEGLTVGKNYNHYIFLIY